MATLKKDLPDVMAEKVDEKGKAMVGPDDKPLTKKYPGQQWKLMGSDPTTNGGWKAKGADTPPEIVATGNLTGATLNDGAGKGVDGKNTQASKGKNSKAKHAATPAKEQAATDADTEADADEEDDDDDTVDVTAKIV